MGCCCRRHFTWQHPHGTAPCLRCATAVTANIIERVSSLAFPLLEVPDQLRIVNVTRIFPRVVLWRPAKPPHEVLLPPTLDT